jgi:hypothetical protein
MQSPVSSRAFERILPHPEEQGGGTGKQVYDYRRLMQVSIEDAYYPEPHACPDFAVMPTAASAQLMKDIGLLLLPEPAGFSVLYDASREENLIGYLLRQRRPSGSAEFETRLSFELSLLDPLFSNFTLIPGDMQSSAQNFYFSNQTAHREEDGSVILNRGGFVGPEELQYVVPVQFPIPVNADILRVRILNLFGDEMLCYPRCVPASVAAAKMPEAISCADAKPPAEPLVCRNTIYADLSSLPEDAYFIRQEKMFGPVSERMVLYTGHSQYCFINLLFSDPLAASPAAGVYPVAGLGGTTPAVVPVRYRLLFAQRSTYWRYYVVLPPKRQSVEGLAIVTDPPGVATFSGPFPVFIGTSTPAFLFFSDESLPMSKKPPARFILDSGDGILMKSMPVASIKQIKPEAWLPPGSGPPFTPRLRDYSDIYVYV